MSQITLYYDERNSLAKKTLAFILSLGVFKTEKKFTAIDKSIQEVKEGKTNTYKNVDEFFKKELSDV